MMGFGIGVCRGGPITLQVIFLDHCSVSIFFCFESEICLRMYTNLNKLYAGNKDVKYIYIAPGGSEMLPCRHIQIFRGLSIPSSNKQIKTICPQTGNTMIVQPQPTVTTAVFTLVGDHYYTTSIVLSLICLFCGSGWKISPVLYVMEEGKGG